MRKRFNKRFSLFKLSLIGLLVVIFQFFLVSQIYAVQPTLGSWTLVGLNNEGIHSVAIDSNNPNVLYVGTASNGIFKSIDGGATWNAINNGIADPTDAGYFTEIVINPSNSNVVYAGGVGTFGSSGRTGIFKSIDGGASWALADNGIIDVGFGGPPQDVHSMIIDPNNPSSLFVAIGTRCGSVYKTTDGASTWIRGSGLPCDPTAVRLDPFNPNIVYARSAQGINRSDDGGINWSNISSFGANSGFSAMTIDIFNSNNLYANDNTGVYKSTDSGVSWTLTNGALNYVYKGIISDPLRPNTVYAGENIGIETSAFMTTDGGAIWTDITNNLPNVGVKRLLVSANDPNTLYAGTDAGLYVYGIEPIMPSVDLNVPLLKQTDPFWGGFTYDSANLWAPPEPTDIARWGCALTSAAMVFRYHKITKLPSGMELTPGTLNVWLKNYTPLDPAADGYIRNGLVNWLSLSRLSKLAKDQNTDFLFDALDYVRFGEDHNQLETDLENNIPGVLGVNNDRHFIVAKGINSEDTFTINDPYDNFEDLSAYSNSFRSLGRFIPSSTDLSYIMLVVDQEVDISVSSSSGELIGESFIQQPLENEETPGDFSGDPLRIFYLPDPASGNYKVKLSSTNNNNYNLDVYYYDINGNVHMDYFSGIVGPENEDNYSIIFDKNDLDNSSSAQNVTFGSLINDINSLYGVGEIKFPNRVSLLVQAKVAKKLAGNSITKKASIKILVAMQKEIKKQKRKGVSENAYNILSNDVSYLINNL